MNFSDKFRLWFIIGRGYTAPTSILPYILAITIASKHYHIDYFLSLLGFIGVVLAHISVNMLDDYFDWKKGAVAEYKKLLDGGLQARTHKCFYAEQGLVSIETVLAVALSMDAIAAILGLYIASKVGFSVILIAACAGLMGFFYSAPPFRLSYHGLGEIAIGIIFGPMIMIGAYITAGAPIDTPLIVASIAAGAMIANISHTHAIMDFKSDVAVGKTSLSTFVKTQDNAIIVQSLIFAFAYAVIAFGVWFKFLPIACLLTFLTIPKTIALIRLMKKPDKEKKIWMEPLENWKKIQEEGSEWFMMRLCLSRNIMTDFIILLGVTYYLFGG